MTSEDRIFREAVNGYGFTEAEQEAEGLYCAGCLCVHTRPTKMYSNDCNETFYCRHAVIRFFNPEEQSG
jgi:hypothetical protein